MRQLLLGSLALSVCGLDGSDLLRRFSDRLTIVPAALDVVQLAAGLPEQGDIIVASVVTIDQGGQEIVFREQGQRAYGGIDHGLLHGVLTFLAGTRCL